MAQYDEKKEYTSQDQFDNMRQQSYRELMNSEIQASVAKQNALKYTQNQLAQSGYANQGVAQSTNLGITNNYRNAMANAQSNYTNAMNNIAQQEYNQQVADSTERYNNLTSLLDSAYDEYNNIDIDAYRRIMGYEGATFDENGNADVSNMNLTQNQKDALLNLYRENVIETNNIVTKGLGETLVLAGKNNAGTLQSLRDQIKITRGNNKEVKKGSGGFKSELDTLENKIDNGSIKNGSMIRLDRVNSNDVGSQRQVYLMYKGGKFYYVTSAMYSAYKGNKYQINGGTVKDETAKS